MQTVAFHTLGCKVNSYETEAVAELFKAKGFERVSFKEKADVYVINSCTVTNTADKKSRQLIRKVANKNPNAVVCVMGCYTQVKPEEVEQIEGVDIVIGTVHRDKLIDYVEEYINKKQKIHDVVDINEFNIFDNLDVTEYITRKRANIKIQEGCESFCSYCIIPYARGKMRSRDPKDTIMNIQKLVDSGHYEIILTGIHTGKYGIEFNDYNLLDLIKDIEENVSGIKRLRISSIEINEVTDELIDYISKSRIMARHLHIPLQSGSTDVLKRMNRQYTKDEFIDRVNYIKSIIPNISITTDVIVGFPGETDEEFHETVQTIKTCEFSDMHVFPYSKREGTVAAEMENQIHESVKKIRVDTLIELGKKLSLNYAKKFENKRLKMIVEEKLDDKFIGHTENYLKVIIDGSDDLIGKEIEVFISKGDYPTCKGKVLA